MKKLISTILVIAMMVTMVNIPMVIADVNEVGLISVEEDFTQYSSLDDVKHFAYEDATHATVDVVNGTGLVIKQTSSTPLVSGAVNKANAPKIGYVFEGKFNEDTDARTSYRINRFSGKYKMTVDFEVSADKHPEPVEGVTITNPYYTLNLGSVENPEELTTSVKTKLYLRAGSNYVSAYNASSAGNSTIASNNVKFTAGEQHQMVIDFDTATGAVSMNIDNYKTSATGNMVSTGYVNAFYIAGMERMLVDSHLTIKKIKFEQTEADADTTAALEVLNSISVPAADPFAVTDDITLTAHENITWSSSDESVISSAGKVTRGEEDKDVTITATYKNGDVILHKDFVLTVKEYVAPPTQVGGLISVEEDFTKYSSVEDIPYFAYDESDHATVSVEEGKGLVVKHIKSTPVLNDASNTNIAVKIAHVVEGTFNENAEKRTSYRINRYSGKYKITMDYEASNEKYTEQVDGVAINSPYYLLTIGGVSSPSSLTTSIGARYTVRVFSTSASLYSSVSNTTVKFTEGVPHQMVMDVDTASKNITMNIDGYKIPATGVMKNDGYLNGFSLSGMERMKDNSFFTIKKIKIEQTEADAETAAALETLDAIGDLAADPYNVTENITLPAYDNVTWTTSDKNVIDTTGKITKGMEDKDVTLTATYKNGDIILYKDYVLTVKRYTDTEIAKADVEAIDLKLGDKVTTHITLPQTGAKGTAFKWSSDNKEVITDEGKVTQAEEDTTVTLTVTGTYGVDGTFTRTFEVFVPKKGVAGDNPVYGDLIYIEEDYTKYTSIADVPYFEYAKTEHSTVEFVEGKGLVVTQTRNTPLLEGAVNKEQTPNISHVIEGNFNYDENYRTSYKLGRFDGKYRLTVEYEVKTDAYTEEVDGVAISRPYFTFAFGSVPVPSSLTTSIQEAVFMRVYSTSLTAYSTTSSGSFGASKFNAEEPHTLVFEFDTVTRQASTNVDNGKTAKTGFLGKPGYINAFSLFGMERMLPGSYFILKKIGAQQLEENENTTKALKALAELPATLVDDPYAVTGDITLPTDNPKITWSSSDTSLITNTGKVNRWFADRDVVLTATYTEYDTVISKEYTLTVKELDNYDTKELMSKSGNDLEFVEILGDSTKASMTVSDKGINVIKTVGENDGDEADMPVYYADFRLFSEDSPYNELTKSSVSSTGYTGIYDVDFDVTADVSGKKPVYIVLGNKANNFGEIVTLAVNSDGIYVKDKSSMYKIHEESTAGKKYSVTFRVDTEQKRVWVYVNGVLAGKFFEFEKIEVIDTLRTVVDENNGVNDGVTINNVKVTEISEEIVPLKKQLTDALGRVSVNNVTESADSVESLKELPKTSGDYNITWVSNSDLIDVENGIVYHGEEGKTVIVSALISVDGVCAKKDFYLYVRKANGGAELVEYYLGDLADVITKQNAEDIRYDISLPSEHKGLTLSWSSSKPEIMDGNGRINKDAEITKPTDVVLTASTTIDGTSHSRNYIYTVSPRAYETVVYEGNSAPESITANGIENIAVAGTSTTNIKFTQAGNGTITLLDSTDEEIIKVNISDNLYNVSYGGGSTVDYPIASGDVVSLDVVTMPDIDRVAVFADGVLIADYVAALNEFSDISSVDVVGGIEVVSTKITTDEYGLLDINVANAGYFDAFKYNVVKENVTMVRDVIFPADVKWTSSNSTLLNVENGNVNVPAQYKFVDVTLTLTSTNYPAVKRVITRKVAVACDEALNLADGAKVSVNATPKPGYDIAYVTDGSFDTAYGTSYAKRTPEFVVDFGKETYVNTLYINESGNSIKNYTVSYSNNNKDWTTVKNGTFTGVDSALVSFDTVYSRYISFTVTESLKSDLYINEIEAYLFAEASELAKLDVEQIKLNTGYEVKDDIELPKMGQFGTTFTWKSSHPDVIDENGKYTKPDKDTDVVLTVTGKNGDATYSKTFRVFVSGKSASGNKPVGGGGGSAGGGGSSGAIGLGSSQVPGFIETNKKDEEVVEPEITDTMFADMDKNHWAYENVKKLKELGIVNGDEKGNFNPSGKVTREQFLKMLVVATNAETSSTKTAFGDVDSKAWYAPYIAAGVNAGLINGITPSTFGVGSEIKRQDMAVMIVRILDSKNIPVTETSEVFDDDVNISEYAKNAVYKVRDAGIINGYSDNTFAPSASLTRAEAATVIIKLLDMLQ